MQPSSSDTHKNPQKKPRRNSPISLSLSTRISASSDLSYHQSHQHRFLQPLWTRASMHNQTPIIETSRITIALSAIPATTEYFCQSLVIGLMILSLMIPCRMEFRLSWCCKFSDLNKHLTVLFSGVFVQINMLKKCLLGYFTSVHVSIWCYNYSYIHSITVVWSKSSSISTASPCTTKLDPPTRLSSNLTKRHCNKLRSVPANIQPTQLCLNHCASTDTSTTSLLWIPPPLKTVVCNV